MKRLALVIVLALSFTSVDAYAQVQLVVKAGRSVSEATRGLESLQGWLTTIPSGAGAGEAAVLLGRTRPDLLDNPAVIEALQAAQAGELNYGHELLANNQQLARLLQDSAFTQSVLAASRSQKQVMTECGAQIAQMTDVAKSIDEAAYVAAAGEEASLIPPGETPAWLSRSRSTSVLSEVAGQKRVIVEGLTPEIEGGRVAIKRIVGEPVEVQTDLVVDGHDVTKGVLRYRNTASQTWKETPLTFVDNDRWMARFVPDEAGTWEYEIQAWVDDFSTWQRNIRRKLDAGRAESVDFAEGGEVVEAAALRASGEDAQRLNEVASYLRSEEVTAEEKVVLAESDEVTALMSRWAERRFASTNYGDRHLVSVNRKRAAFSSWYEFFPRSVGEAGTHGTLKEAESMLPYVKEMGFDVVYLPPVHPIGRAARKGPNNIPDGGADAVGSPWAIGGEEGGHKAIHPQLGTVDDFEHFVQTAKENDLEVAMDLAFQASPDHPYLREAPQWFRTRPDGTIAYAENPPKLYQDIVNFHWEGEEWPEMWTELKSVVDFWTDKGVRVFRVDNPHTKPIRFWRWLIENVKAEHPDVVFLAEAFTKPKLMNALAKAGFDQGYTYFTWRTTKWEIQQYMTELTRSSAAEYFRPNFWPNTPDILPAHLQDAAPAMFKGRLVLASTLSSNYGIYGPAYELMERTPLAAGREEYLNSEKFQLKEWALDDPQSLRDYIGRVNWIRNEHPALQNNRSLNFLETHNDQLIAYSKQEGDDVIVTVVNLDPANTQIGKLEVPLEQLGLSEGQSYEMIDLLNDQRYTWSGRSGYIELNPNESPAHIFEVRAR